MNRDSFFDKPILNEGLNAEYVDDFVEIFSEYGVNTLGELDEFDKLCEKIGLIEITDIDDFLDRTEIEGDTVLEKLRNYAKTLGDDFVISEENKEEPDPLASLQRLKTNDFYRNFY